MLHLRAVPPQTSCDKSKRAEVHRDLRLSLEEEKISRELIKKANAAALEVFTAEKYPLHPRIAEHRRSTPHWMRD